jgi:hypothetical protein
MLPVTKTQCFENECCTLELDPAAGCLIFTWKGLLPSKAFREVHQQALSLIRKHQLTKVLGDARRMKTIGSSDAEWIVSFWMPSAIAAGFRFNAIVESSYLFNQLSINSIVEKTDPEQVTFNYFKDPESALFWLKSC